MTGPNETRDSPSGPLKFLGAALSDLTPPTVDASAGDAGIGPAASRDDHVHQVLTGTAVSVGTVNAPGVLDTLSRSDHVHASIATTNNSIADTIAADQDDYSPAGWDTSSILRVTPSGANREITGFVAPTASGTTERRIVNDDTTNTLILRHENGSSAAANRILTNTGLSLSLLPREVAVLRYDAVQLRWQVVALGVAVTGVANVGVSGEGGIFRDLVAGQISLRSVIGRTGLLGVIVSNDVVIRMTNNSITDTIAADQDDYNPTGWDTSSLLGVTPSGANREITGLVAPATDGTPERVITNKDTTNTLILRNENGSSAAANRILTNTGVSLNLLPDESAILRYDSGISRWQVVALGVAVTGVANVGVAAEGGIFRDLVNGQISLRSVIGRTGLLGSIVSNDVVIRLTNNSITDTIVADEDDYNPTGWDTSSLLGVTPSGANREITGLVAPATDGTPERVITNKDTTNTLILRNENVSSAAANRILTNTGLSLNLLPDESAIVRYDSGISRWLVIAIGVAVTGVANVGGAAAGGIFRDLVDGQISLRSVIGKDGLTGAINGNNVEIGEITGPRDYQNNNLINAKTVSFNSTIVDTVAASAVTVDFSAGPKHRIVLDAASVTVTLIAPPGDVDGLTLEIVQDGSGSRGIGSWVAGTGITAVLFPDGGTKPTLSTGGGEEDLLTFHFNDTTNDIWAAGFRSNFAP